MLIPFPDTSRDTGAGIQGDRLPAKVVYDFGVFPTEANARRRAFHACMSEIERFGAVPAVSIRTRDQIKTLIAYASTEELKNIRYRMNYDTLQSILYLAQRVVESLIEQEPDSFRTPSRIEIAKQGLKEFETALLEYVFSHKPIEDRDLKQLKAKIIQGYSNFAETLFWMPGRDFIDAEMIHAELAEILPIIIDLVKNYMTPFRQSVQMILFGETGGNDGGTPIAPKK